MAKTIKNTLAAQNNPDGAMEFARYAGPGTRLYPSPRPSDVKDLALTPMKWVQINPAYNGDGVFMRDRQRGIFDVIRANSIPEDLDLAIPAELDRFLDPAQREMIRLITATDETLKPEYRSAIAVDELVADTGIALAGTSVTVSFLKAHHRPFLMALLSVEQRFRKRKDLIALVGKRIKRIETLPG